MKRKKIKAASDSTSALKKCGNKKKALIVVVIIAGSYIAYYIVKQAKKKRAQELSERLRFGKRKSDLDDFESEMYKFEEDDYEDNE